MRSVVDRFMAATGLSLAFGWPIAGKFRIRSYLYPIRRGRGDFANATCPWSK